MARRNWLLLAVNWRDQLFHTAKAKELRALFTKKDWCVKGHGNATFIVWWRIFTFESKFHQKAWYARDQAPKAAQTACASREQVCRESIIPSAQRFCVRVLPAQCQAFTGRELCAKCLEVSTKRALKGAKAAQCSPLLCLSLGCWTCCCWSLRNFGGSHDNACFRRGEKKKTSCFWWCSAWQEDEVGGAWLGEHRCQLCQVRSHQR